MKDLHHIQLMHSYGCTTLLNWLRNENAESDEELWQQVLVAIAEKPALDPLKLYLLENPQTPVTKRAMIEKIIQMLCEDGSIRFDTALESMCTLFKSVLRSQLAVLDQYPDPGVGPCFHL